MDSKKEGWWEGNIITITITITIIITTIITITIIITTVIIITIIMLATRTGSELVPDLEAIIHIII